ncbi:MAG: class I SAM-dependent methyltransferase [Nitrospira sp.]
MVSHLAEWGLRHFTSDAAYFAWQRQTVSPADLNRLHACIARKRAPDAGPAEETAFYDAAAEPSLIPALYSQRYEYYLAVAPRVAARIPPAHTVLDFGCGIGILTTYFARQHPDVRFVGVDRSSASIGYARRRADELHVTNIEFHAIDLDGEAVAGPYDLVVATHALLQAEQDPGVPSDRWDTFARARDSTRQTMFETRTGLAPRLDRVVSALAADGRMIVFEKARLQARRIPFQRALAARGLRLLEPPQPVRYALVEEVTEDGPFYVLTRGAQTNGLEWSELPEEEDGGTVDLDSLRRRTGIGDEPLYETHAASAQSVWESLTGRRVVKEFTREGPDGRQLHAELGMTHGLLYLYVANTFDQRQILFIEQARARVLETYYAEIENG